MSGVILSYETKAGDTFKIEYREQGNAWVAEMEDEYITATSLAELKAKLERKTAPKAKARRVPCIVSNNYNGSFQFALATSVDDHQQYVRVTYEKGGKREQLQRTRVYGRTPENMTLAAEVGELGNQRDALDRKVRDLMAKLTLLDLATLKDD